VIFNKVSESWIPITQGGRVDHSFKRYPARSRLVELTVCLLWFLLFSSPTPAGSSEPPPAAGSTVISPESPESDVVEPPSVDMNFQDVEIRDFVSYVSEVTGTNFILGLDVQGRITVVSPTKVPVNEVFRFFQSVLEVHGYTTVQARGLVKIVPSATARGKAVETRSVEPSKPPEDKLVTQVIHLHYLSPDDAKKLLTPLLSKGGVIVSHPSSGTLMITDFHPNIERLQKIIKAVDVPGP
jgi:general secretion pathway protein D